MRLVSKKVLSSVGCNLQTDDLTSIYHEKENWWTGPSRVLKICNKYIHAGYSGRMTEMSLDRHKSWQIENEVQDLMYDNCSRGETVSRENIETIREETHKNDWYRLQ